VLASGELVNANATFNPDLWRALKGSGTNFAVVTRYDLQAFPQGEILGGSLMHDISNRAAVFKAFSNIAGADEFDVNASLVSGLLFNSGTGEWSINNGIVYTQPVEDPVVFREIMAIPTTGGSVAITNYSSFANEGTGLVPKLYVLPPFPFPLPPSVFKCDMA
jgi:hypothetical protein